MDMRTVELAKSQASTCSVFANYRRVLILWALAERERSVGEIATAVNASLQSTSQHLRLMKERGILQSQRDGQTIFYSIAPDTMPPKCWLLIEARKEQLI